MLTPKQKELLAFIDTRLQETGVPPSFEEMKEALALQSKSGVHRLIMALEERGFIRRRPHRARAIEVIKLPEAMSDTQRRGLSLVEGGRRQAQLAPPPTAYAQLIRAALAAARGDSSRAIPLYTEAVACFEAVDMHLCAAAARRRLGECKLCDRGFRHSLRIPLPAG